VDQSLPKTYRQEGMTSTFLQAQLLWGGKQHNTPITLCPGNNVHARGRSARSRSRHNHKHAKVVGRPLPFQRVSGPYSWERLSVIDELFDTPRATVSTLVRRKSFSESPLERLSIDCVPDKSFLDFELTWANTAHHVICGSGFPPDGGIEEGPVRYRFAVYLLGPPR
jgi:hypothetical protein